MSDFSDDRVDLLKNTSGSMVRRTSEQKGLFTHRNGQLFFVGQLISQVGSSMQVVSLGWIALELSHNGLVLGLVNAAPILAMLTAGLLGGSVADRFPARPVLMLTNAGQGLVAVGLGVLAVLHVLAVWQLILSALVVGCMSAVSVPATLVFVSEIAAPNHLRQAVTVNNAILDLSYILGAALVGPTIAVFGSAGVIWINAVSYLAVIAGLLLIRRNELYPRQRAAKAVAQLWRAVVYLMPRLDLQLFLVITAVVSLFAAGLPTLLLLMADGKGASTYGAMLTAVSVGSLAGAGALWRAKPALGGVLLGSVLLGLLEAAIVLASNTIALVAVLFLIGVVSIMLRTALLTLVQSRTRADLRGRVLAIFLSIYRGGWLLGTLMSGWLAHVWGPRTLIGLEGSAAAVLVFAICIILAATRALSISRTVEGCRFVLPRSNYRLWGDAPDEIPE